MSVIKVLKIYQVVIVHISGIMLPTAAQLGSAQWF